MYSKNLNMVFLLIIFSVYSSIGFADENVIGKKLYTYKDCLKDSFLGGHHYTAEDTKALCKEITNKQLIYEHVNDKLEPADEFTRCFEKEKESVDSQYKNKGDAKFYGLMLEKAKLECELGE